MGRIALITGASGQDGWYLARLLHQNGYAVHLHSRSGISWSTERWAGVHIGDVKDRAYLTKLVSAILPDEIYNLAAVSSPSESWDAPLETAAVNALVPQYLCELILKQKPDCRLFQATSSEVFGNTSDFSQDETTPHNPVSPYAISKDYAHRIVGVYRERYGLHLSSGILFNHESPRRPLSYVSQKIAFGAAAISLGLTGAAELSEAERAVFQNGRLRLGNLNVRRDFGFAGDHVEAMHLILRADRGGDYVIGTGEHHSIADFCDAAFKHVNLDWSNHIVSDPALFRKNDSHYTHANINKIATSMRWKPRTGFRELVRLMVDAQIESLRARTMCKVLPRAPL